MHESLLDLVGGTPLVRLHRVTEGIAAAVYVKLEYLNPGGSVKDRAALSMVLDAERSGALAPGGTIVEGTSGNTGTGLAQVAAARGYGMVVVLPDTTAVEKVDVLRAYGAEVVLTAPALPREHPDHVVRLAERIAAERPGGWWADQYGNPANPRVHRETTGPEIWADTGGRVTHLVSTIGTGGTISGTGEYLKSRGDVTVVGADPVTSSYGGGDGSPFLVEASGHYVHPETVSDDWPASYHRDVVDRVETVADRESILTARRLAREEGLLVGGSSGLATAVALRVARGLGPDAHDAVVVALLPDSGRAYLSKYFSTDWCHRMGFVDDDRPGVLAAALSPTHAVVTVTTAATRGEALAALETLPADQPLLPVVRAGRDPRHATAASEVLGALRAGDRAALVGGADVRLELVPGSVPPTVGTGETPPEALERVDAAGASDALVLRDGRLAGVVTRARLAELAADPVPATVDAKEIPA